METGGVIIMVLVMETDIVIRRMFVFIQMGTKINPFLWCHQESHIGLVIIGIEASFAMTRTFLRGAAEFKVEWSWWISCKSGPPSSVASLHKETLDQSKNQTTYERLLAVITLYIHYSNIYMWPCYVCQRASKVSLDDYILALQYMNKWCLGWLYWLWLIN